MKKVLILSIVIIMAFLVFAKKQDGPTIEFEQTKIDFKEIPTDTTVTAKFDFKNTGTDTLKIFP